VFCLYNYRGHLNFGIYTLSGKNIPDIFDRNLKTDYQILIILTPIF